MNIFCYAHTHTNRASLLLLKRSGSCKDAATIYTHTHKIVSFVFHMQNENYILKKIKE